MTKEWPTTPSAEAIATDDQIPFVKVNDVNIAEIYSKSFADFAAAVLSAGSYSGAIVDATWDEATSTLTFTFASKTKQPIDFSSLVGTIVAAYSPKPADQTLLEGLTLGKVNYVIRDKVALDTANANFAAISQMNTLLSNLNTQVKALARLTSDLHEDEHKWELATAPRGLWTFVSSTGASVSDFKTATYAPSLSGPFGALNRDIVIRLQQGADISHVRVRITYESGHESIHGSSEFISDNSAVVDATYDYYSLDTVDLLSAKKLALETDKNAALSEYHGKLLKSRILEALNLPSNYVFPQGG